MNNTISNNILFAFVNDEIFTIGPQERLWMNKSLHYSVHDEQQSASPFISSVQLSIGIILGIIFHVGCNQFICNRSDRSCQHKQCRITCFSWICKTIVNTIITLICFLIFLLLLPIFFILYIGFSIYRFVIYLTLKRKYGTHFKGFLSGEDAIWKIDEENCKCIINGMQMLEKELKSEDDIEKFPKEILEMIRERLCYDALIKNPNLHKMFYKINRESGFCFWTDDNQLSVNDYIRFLPDLPKDGSDYRTKIQKVLGEHINRDLPENNSSTWEILVARECEKTISHDGKPMIQIAIMARFHHSLCDGVSIVRLFIDSYFDHNQFNIDQVQKSVTATNKPWNFKTFVQSTFTNIMIFITGPACLMKANFLRKPDNNQLHRRENLSGQKVISWYVDENEDPKLLKQIKKIKSNLPGVRFSDVFLTALSDSLENYFLVKGYEIPDHLTSVMTSRIALEGIEVKLQNKFSVFLQEIPIKGLSEQKADQTTKYYTKLLKLKDNAESIRNTPILLISYWMVLFIAGLLPDTFINRLINITSHNTMVFSNLPSTESYTMLNNTIRVKYPVFWLPNRGFMGIGLSLMSYWGKLAIGLVVDTTIINNTTELDQILSHIVDTISQIAEQKSPYNLNQFNNIC